MKRTSYGCNAAQSGSVGVHARVQSNKGASNACKDVKKNNDISTIKQSLGVFVPRIQSNYSSGSRQKIYHVHWGNSLKHVISTEKTLCVRARAFKHRNYLGRSTIKISTKELGLCWQWITGA